MISYLSMRVWDLVLYYLISCCRILDFSCIGILNKPIPHYNLQSYLVCLIIWYLFWLIVDSLDGLSPLPRPAVPLQMPSIGRQWQHPFVDIFKTGFRGRGCLKKMRVSCNPDKLLQACSVRISDVPQSDLSCRETAQQLPKPGFEVCPAALVHTKPY